MSTRVRAFPVCVVPCWDLEGCSKSLGIRAVYPKSHKNFRPCGTVVPCFERGCIDQRQFDSHLDSFWSLFRGDQICLFIFDPQDQPVPFTQPTNIVPSKIRFCRACHHIHLFSIPRAFQPFYCFHCLLSTTLSPWLSPSIASQFFLALLSA
jgi:hypothetical protein